LPTKKKQDRDLLFDSKRLEEQLEEKENSKKKRKRSKGKKEKKEDDELFDDMQLEEDEEAEIEGLVTEATKPPKRIELLRSSVSSNYIRFVFARRIDLDRDLIFFTSLGSG
jgi:transcription initiation factor IIF auxiliary subunit